MDHIRTTVSESGLEVGYFYDEIADRLVIKHRFDHEPVLDENARLRHEAQTGAKGYSPSRDLRRAASIPEDVVMIWRQMGVDIFKDEDWPKVAALLDSPEWAHLRTAPGRLSKRPLREYPLARRRNR